MAGASNSCWPSASSSACPLFICFPKLWAQEHDGEEASVPGSSLPLKRRFVEVLPISQETPLSYVELQEGLLLSSSQPNTPGASGQNAGTGNHSRGGSLKGVVFISRGTPDAKGTGVQSAGGATPVQPVGHPTGGVQTSMNMGELMPHLFYFARSAPSPAGASGRVVVISKPSTKSSTAEGEGLSGSQHPSRVNNVPIAPPQSADSTKTLQEGADQSSWSEDQPLPFQFTRHPTGPQNDQKQGDKKRDGSNAGKGAGDGMPPHQPPNASSTGNDDLNLPENATEQLILAELVFRGVGTELLECIQVPATYHQMDFTVDRYCGRLKISKLKYPNNPFQTACRKHAKHVILQFRRVLETCKQSRYIPQVGHLGALSRYIEDVVTHASAPETWKHPDLESNSCVFAHGLQETAEKQAKSKRKKVSKKEKDVKALEMKNMVLSLRLLLLLLQSHLVEPSIVGFLLSLLDMSSCKVLKNDPPYKVSDKLKVSTKGLFQATLANLIAETFIVDIRLCATEATTVLGSRESVLCPNLIAFAKLRATLPPILKAVAQSDWEGAKRKANTFEKDFEAKEVFMKDLEAMQASIKVYAVMCVSLSKFASLRCRLLSPSARFAMNTFCVRLFPSQDSYAAYYCLSGTPIVIRVRGFCGLRVADLSLTTWKGSAAKWVLRQKLLSRLLQKMLGEVTASIFSDQEAAKDFAFAVRSADRHSSADPEALLKHASMHVAAVELDSRFFCQTGLPGLGNTVSGALKVAVKSLARMKKKGNRKKDRRGLSSILPLSFLDRLPSSRFGGQAVAEFQRKARRRDDDTFVPSSFLSSPPSTPNEYPGSTTAVLGSVTGMTLKSALRQIDHTKTRVILQKSKFLKQSWFKILAKIFFRLKAGEKGIVLFSALVWVSLFIISFPFSVVSGLGVEAIAAFCVISVVLVVLELMERQSAFHIPAVAGSR
ncbi:hypothetical protein ACSSS7_003028 [Eimeria intestinalis]